MNKRLLISSCVALLMISCSKDQKYNQQGLLKINGTELYVEAVGKGEPIIVIHGGPILDHGYLQDHFGRLENDFQVIYYDQRLSGRSSSDLDTSQVNIVAFIEDIDAIRKHFGYEKIHVLGHSWGGLMAMEYTLRHGKSVKSLLLINSMAPSYSIWKEEQMKLAAKQTKWDSAKRQEIIQSDLFKENKPEAIKQLLRLSFKSQLVDSTLADSLDFYIPENYMDRSSKFGQLSTYLFNYDLTDKLESLEVPTLVMYGEREPSAEISGKVLNEKIPQSKLLILDDSGHFPFLEQPEAFNSAVLNFLNTNSSLKGT